MSWHCLPELAAESSVASCSDGAPLLPSKWNPTLAMCCLPASATESLIRSLFGTTCAHSTDILGAETSMSSAEDFPARTSASPEAVQDSTEIAPDSGQKWRGSLARFDPNTCSLKTAQCSLFEDLTESSPTLPRSGLMWRGECYPLPTSAPRICASGSGSSDEILPTPTCDSATHRTGRYAQGGMPLTARVARWPTPCATAHKGWSKNHNRAATDDRLDYTIEREANEAGSPGRLNPEFVEWLMGWPIGHTGLEPVAMDKCREWLQRHSPNCGRC